MAVYDPQAYSITRILHSIKQRLVDGTSLDESYIRLVATDNYDLLANDSQLVIVRILGPIPWGDAGAGRSHRPFYRNFYTAAYTRSSLDFTGSDDVALTTSADSLNLAHLVLEENIFNAMDEYYPAVTPNSAGIGSLLLEPIHPIDSSSGSPSRKDPDVGWIVSRMMWSMTYMTLNKTPAISS